ncbi:hypothetical protein H5410_041904 [Solanum commersonii]|uniref:Uncharacterized protein n=1 Tax=Solanum commersonii TaxID=4109 RepID=A0A9J5XWY9_SOLCO|nr:hypothetical protein H5410_041904 [Solanum commersonii]
MAYCEKIHPMPPEDSWIVPLDVIEREIPLPYVDPSKPGSMRYKKRRGVVPGSSIKSLMNLLYIRSCLKMHFFPENVQSIGEFRSLIQKMCGNFNVFLNVFMFLSMYFAF